MAKIKKISLVDSFVFNKAKEEVEKILPEEHHENTIGTPTEHHENTIGSVKEHDKNTIRTVFPKNTIGTTCVSLSTQHFKVYKWFLHVGEEGVFNKTLINRETGIPYMTIRKALWKFEKLGIISMKYDKALKEFEYKVNLNIKVKEPKRNLIGTIREQYGNTDIISSSSYNKLKPTTKKKDSVEGTIKEHDLIQIKKIMTQNSEIAYWRQKGLQAEQIKNWMEISGCGIESMIQYLCYCRFEMVDCGLEESKPIKNVFNWFFRILEKSGSYPRPQNYKSQKQKELDQKQIIVDQKKKEAEDAKKLYLGKINAEQDKVFWEMMNNPEGELYNKCFEKLNSFQKKLRNQKTSKIFEMGMRDAFDKLE